MKHTKVLILAVTAISLVATISHRVSAAASLSINKNLSLHESPTNANFSKSFKLLLSQEPTDTVTTVFTTDNQCLLSHAGEAFTNGGSLISDWDVFDFTVQARDDDVQEGSHSCSISFSSSSADTNFDGVTLDVVIPITDDGDTTFTPRFDIVQLVSNQLEEGGYAVFTYRIQANANVEDPVTITAFGGTNCELIVSNSRQASAERTIKSGGSSTASYTLAAKQDEVFEGFHSCIITHVVDTIDEQFSGVTVTPLVISVRDDDLSDAQQQQLDADAEQLDQDIAASGIVDIFDANNDGIDDSKQAHVQSFVNQVSGSRQALIVDGCDIDGSVVSAANTQASNDETLHFPYGVLSFRLLCPDINVASVSWLLDQLYPTDYPWQLKKVADSGIARSVIDAGFSDIELQKGTVTAVTYQIEDGGPYDADGQVNGVIDDPVGLSLPLAILGDGSLARVEESTQISKTALAAGSISLIALAIFGLSRPKVINKIKELVDGKPNDKPQIDKY